MKLRRQKEKAGLPVPESAQEPEIGLEDVFFLKAFLELQHDKTQFRSIPWTAVNEYAKRYNLSPGMFEKLREIVFACNSMIEDEFATRAKLERAQQERANKTAKRQR